jgi:hypothetical protein
MRVGRRRGPGPHAAVDDGDGARAVPVGRHARRRHPARLAEARAAANAQVEVKAEAARVLAVDNAVVEDAVRHTH